MLVTGTLKLWLQRTFLSEITLDRSILRPRGAQCFDCTPALLGNIWLTARRLEFSL